MSAFAGIEVTAEVLSAACAGDARAQETIYRSYQRPVYSLIRRLISRPAIADELFQETFIEVLRSLRSYSGEGAFGGWVRAIAVNKCLMYLRSPWHRSFAYVDTDENEPVANLLVDAASGPDVQVQASADVGNALATLPPLTRTVVWLHDVEGYTHGEIARLTGRTTSFSKSQLARAHQRLRELLDPQSESLPCTHLSTIC
ncbi:MAG TPA: RNA polymerase sigma factor [Steroidobacteraceae bacterium]|nr:RNA polymerase sigma factor [Steroidobacteraceae bacterium]